MTNLKRLLVVPDAHIPFHNKRAWALFLKAAAAFKPNIVVAIGDLADCCAISSHSKSPKRALGWESEIAAVNAELDKLDALGADEYIYVEGNHEDRLPRYLRDKAPELHDVESIPKLFRLKERGWEFVPYKRHIKRGKVYYTHDVGTAGRYAAYRALEAFGHSVVTGHTHRLSYVVESNAVGEARVSATFGWLGDVNQIDYMSRINAMKNWALGFGIGYLDEKTGFTYLTPVPIVANSCVVEGKLYDN